MVNRRRANNDIAARTKIAHTGLSLLIPTYPGGTRLVLQQIVEMTLNGSGIRDIARVLHVSTATVIQEFKKNPTTPKCQSDSIKSASKQSRLR